MLHVSSKSVFSDSLMTAFAENAHIQSVNIFPLRLPVLGFQDRSTKSLRQQFNLLLSCCDGLFPGAVELPSYMVGCYLMDRIGRKKTCAPALLLAGIACTLIIVLPTVRTMGVHACT